MSCTGRPRIPPALFTRSSHHSVERSPAAPTGAAMPARIVSTPIFTGPPACEHRRRVVPHRCRGGPGAHESEQASPSRPHGVLLEGARLVPRSFLSHFSAGVAWRGGGGRD